LAFLVRIFLNNPFFRAGIVYLILIVQIHRFKIMLVYSAVVMLQ